VKITVDTNVLLRAVTLDDHQQAARAVAALHEAELIAVTSACLCELIWVLTRGYCWSAADTAAALRRLVNADNVECDRPAIEAGLALMDRGGDFADGVIAYEGGRLGGHVFTTFDRKAVRLIKEAGGEARLLDPAS
jgi:predicted nucleic-acid-binding protein